MKRILALVLVIMMCILTAGVAGAATDGPAIVDFSYEQGSYPDKTYSFAVYQDEGVTWFSATAMDGAELDINVRVDKSIFAEIAALVNQHQLAEWNGFSEMEEDMEAGDMFSLSILFEDESEVFAEGSQKFPANFKEANGAIMKYFQDKAAELEEAGMEEEDVDTEGMEAY